MDDDYYAYDAAMADFEARVAKEKIAEFQLELLQSYYIKNHSIMDAPRETMEEARAVLDLSPTSAFVLGAVVCETTVKSLLLKPVVYGLVHQDYAAALVADLTVGQAGFDRFSKLLIEVLARLGNIDLRTYVRPGAEGLLLGEYANVVPKRNGILHRAQKASLAEATACLEIASTFLERIFPAFLYQLELALFDGGIAYRSYKEWDFDPVRQRQMLDELWASGSAREG